MFILKYFDASLQKWIKKEIETQQLILYEIKQLKSIKLSELFVYEIIDNRIKNKWIFGLVEDDVLKEEIF